MSYTLFISDLHLDAARPAITQALAVFLDQNKLCDSLFILGDLFEAWVGDDDDCDLALEITKLLSDFSSSGPGLYLMQGNRDFLLGERFCTAVGAQLLPDPTVIDLYGKPTLLMHGDSLCTDDVDYQAFRKTARDPKWQADLLNHSLDERRALAKQLRSISKESSSNKAEDIMDVTTHEVHRMMTEQGVKQLIHGHTHRPARHEASSGTRWVLGDWDQRGWFIRADKTEVELENFNI
ncbi:MAG: UDP-2,3-diacylglucosamine diphosphatase [Halioglobus sp.]